MPGDLSMSSDLRDALEAIAEPYEEAHHFLHELVDHYHEPILFRTNLNAFIQNARNVTFRIQSYKGDIPDFNRWYNRWQDYLRADPVMAWISQARTDITKRKGLRARSQAKVSVTYRYTEPHVKETELDPEAPLEAVILAGLHSVPAPVRPYAIVEVTRRWEFDELPGREVISALLEASRVLEALLEDLLRFIDKRTDSVPAIAVMRHDPIDCLGDLADVYTIRLDADTGDVMTPREHIQAYDPELGEAAGRRYGIKPSSFPGLASNDPFELGQAIYEMSKIVLQRDKHHVPIFWLRHPANGWTAKVIMFDDKAEKFAAMHRLAKEVTEHGWDALVAVAEAWMAPATSIEKQRKLYPEVAEAPDRREALLVYAITSDDHCKTWNTLFSRRFGRIRLGETSVMEDNPNDLAFLLPIRRAWAAQRGETISDPDF